MIAERTRHGTVTCTDRYAWPLVARVTQGTDFVQVAAGRFFACALRAAGSLVCWGKVQHDLPGPYTQVGRHALRHAPVPADARPRAAQISAGDDKLCALRPTGDIDCPRTPRRAGHHWRPARAHAPPRHRRAHPRIEAARRGGLHAGVRWLRPRLCAGAQRDRRLLGPGQRGAAAAASLPPVLRQGATLTRRAAAAASSQGVRTPEGYQFRQLSVSPRQHTCAITLENEVMCWGRNRAGECVPPFLQAAYRRASRPANEVQLDAAGRVLRTPEEVDADDAAVLPSFKIVSAGQRVSCGLTVRKRSSARAAAAVRVECGGLHFGGRLARHFPHRGCTHRLRRARRRRAAWCAGAAAAGTRPRGDTGS